MEHQNLWKMKTLNEIINLVKTEAQESNRSSIFFNPTTIPKPLLDAGGPQDLIDFYSQCSGFSYRPKDAFRYVIVRPHEFVRADHSDHLSHALCRESLQKNNITKDLYIIAIQGGDDDETITIDLSKKYQGRCYESYPDKLGTPLSQVYAKSFTELLNILILQAEEFEERHKCYGYFGDESLLTEPVDAQTLWQSRWNSFPKEYEYEAFWAELKERQDMNSKADG